MKCEQCDQELQPGWKICPQCGRKLPKPGTIDLPAFGAGFGREPDELISRPSLSGLADSASARVEERLRAVQDRVQDRLQQLSSKAKSLPAAGGALAQTGASSEGLAPVLEELLRPKHEEMKQAEESVRTSAFVQSNLLYKERARTIGFYFDADNLLVNAGATDRPAKLSDGSAVSPPAIIYLGGMSNAVCLVSAALAIYMKERLDSILRFTFHDLGRAVVASRVQFSTDNAAGIFDRNLGFKLAALLRSAPEVIFAGARAFRTSMYMHTLAHELGHIALGHTLRFESHHNLDIARNQEREADSFAASVLSSCPGREFHFLGAALSTALFVWTDRAAGSPAASTHPCPRERFQNLFATHSEAARDADQQFGLDQRRLNELLPL